MEIKRRKFGFTIVELLTVMSVIAILMALLAPALQKVRVIATDTKQKAQFHSIGISLDMFNADMEGYPDSTALGTGTGPYTVGAQHLAEALIGRDYQGFDPLSTWDADDDAGVSAIYADSGQEQIDSLERRKGPYLNVENTEAFRTGLVYTDAAGDPDCSPVYDSNVTPAPVLTDAYRVKRITLGGKVLKAGTPILYYKANTGSILFPEISDSIGTTDPPTFIYNSIDNEDLLDLGTVKDAVVNDMDSSTAGRRKFYDEITNPKIPIGRPYNQSSYLLISAGYDGKFGNNDDIHNFSD